MACQEPTELVVTAEALAVSSVLAAVEQKRDLGISPAEESDLDFVRVSAGRAGALSAATALAPVTETLEMG